MPINYKNYASNWKSEIRPRILERAGNKCEVCGVENGEAIFRGIYNGVQVYQTGDGSIYNASNSEFITEDAYAEIHPLSGDENQMAIKVVLTVMHLDHDTTHNEDDNLKAACQKCHLNYDKDHHKKNATETRTKKKKLQTLF